MEESAEVSSRLSVPKIKSTACVIRPEPAGPTPESRHQVFWVNESYIKQLVAENKRLRKQLEASKGTASGEATPSATTAVTNSPKTVPASPPTRPDTSHPLTLSDQPWFIDITLHHTPTPINEAADTAFATRFRQVLSDPSDPPCMHLPHVDYAGDDTLNSLTEISHPWPKPSRARLLMSVALMHASRCYHIVRRTEVLDALELSISTPNWRDPVMTCKLRALFALGELCSSRFVPPGHEFPGIGHFAQATKILNYLTERPTLDFIEIRLMLSLYSFTLNRTYAAYTLAGSALRLAVIMGLHLNIPSAQLSDPVLREHRNRVFWTAYIFDRMWASKLGCPPAIQDAEVKVDLPAAIISSDFGFADYYASYVKLASISMNTVRSIYTGKDQAATLFTKVQQRVKELKGWVDGLPPSLHWDTDTHPNSYHDYDLLSLHLALNKTIVLATRPILLYGLSLLRSTPPKAIPTAAKPLIDTCIRCARHSCRILSESWINGAFPALYHDLTQYLFSSLTVVAVSSLMAHEGSMSDRECFEDAVELLAQLRDSGNFSAKEFWRHAELIAAAVKKADERSVLTTEGDAGGGVEELGTAETALEELFVGGGLEMQFSEEGLDLFGEGDGLFWPEFGFPV
ncbi:hypothetical protein OQA88_1438 [Cercophora sp. LCS_1]